MRYFARLNPLEQSKVRDDLRVLVAEKNWEGVDGLTISEEIKVTIAGQSALMLLGVEDYYFDNVKTILVSPAPMRRKTAILSTHALTAAT